MLSLAFKKSTKCPQALVALVSCSDLANFDALKHELNNMKILSCNQWDIMRRCLETYTKPCNTPYGTKKFFKNLDKLYNVDISNTCFAGKLFKHLLLIKINFDSFYIITESTLFNR